MQVLVMVISLSQWFLNCFFQGRLQGYFKWTRNPRRNCHKRFFHQTAVIKVSYCKQNYAR